MDPQPTLALLVRINRRPRCLSSGHEKGGSHKGKDLGYAEDVEVFPSQISEAYSSPYWQYGNGRYHAKGWFRPTAFQGVLTCVDEFRVIQHPQPPTNEPHLSALFSCLHFQCWTNTLYTTLTSRAIKEQLCGPVRFHYAYLLPHRWEYRYVTTV